MKKQFYPIFVMLYQCKQQPEDFVVEEVLPSLPSGKGEVFYVFFEKKNLTTMEVIAHLQRVCSLSREELGIAGLKDKAGITRQWISIFKSRLERVGGEAAFLSGLSEVVKVLDRRRGKEPLRVGGNRGNQFFVRLRALQEVAEEKKNLIAQNIEKLKEKGFPNCFGAQRFGKGSKNFWEAKEVMETGMSSSGAGYPLRFMLQAYASMYFNEYVMRRWEKSQLLLGGDVVVDRYFASGAQVGVYQDQGIQLFDYIGLKQKNSESAFFEPGLFQDVPTSAYERKVWIPTGPLLGWNLLLAPRASKARVRDDGLLELAGFDQQALEVCRKFQLRGIRRPLWVYVDDLQWEWEGDDVVLRFSLPTGSYATVVLAFVLQGVDSATLKDNRLEIPRMFPVI